MNIKKASEIIRLIFRSLEATTVPQQIAEAVLGVWDKVLDQDRESLAKLVALCTATVIISPRKEQRKYRLYRFPGAWDDWRGNAVRQDTPGIPWACAFLVTGAFEESKEKGVRESTEWFVKLAQEYSGDQRVYRVALLLQLSRSCSKKYRVS